MTVRLLFILCSFFQSCVTVDLHAQTARLTVVWHQVVPKARAHTLPSLQIETQIWQDSIRKTVVSARKNHSVCDTPKTFASNFCSTRVGGRGLVAVRVVGGPGRGGGPGGWEPKFRVSSSPEPLVVFVFTISDIFRGIAVARP